MQNQVNRIAFMDAMRSVLMMLGVVLHSANVYLPSQSWAIYSENPTDVARYLVQFIHTFRMPAFFVVAGYFCVFTLVKYQPKKFLRIRLARIGIPLIITALTLNSLQSWLLVETGWRAFSFEKYVFDGGWVSHLWFLINLIVYFTLSAIFALLLKPVLIKIWNKLHTLLTTTPMIIVLLVLPLCSVAVLGLSKIGFPLYSTYFGVLHTFDLLIYLPFFVLGAVLGGNNDLLFRFSNTNPKTTIPIILLVIIINRWLPESPDLLFKVLKEYLTALTVWLSVSLCFYLFYRYLNTPSGRWYYLSDASYSVYLFHHILVISLGMILVWAEIPGLIGMVILIVGTLVITLLIHHFVILNSKVARYLFNGK